MDIAKFVIKALGMQDVVIENCEYNEQNLSAKVTVRQIKKSCVCPECREPLYGIKQWKKRKLFGIPFGSFLRLDVIFFQLQGACGRCLMHRLAFAPFLHPKFKRLTTAFAEYAGRWMEETTCAAVERMTGCSSMNLWRLDQWRMKRMKKEYKLSDEVPLKLMSADEVHMFTVRSKRNRMDKSMWQKKFITNLVSYEASKVVSNARGRSSQSLKNCLSVLTSEQRERIKFIAVDMHDGFIAAAESHCPNAKVAVDRFHVAEALNKAFDEIRRAEFTKAKDSKDDFQKEMLMPSKRFILMERERDLSRQDQSRLDRLRKLNQNINTAMILIEYFHAVLDKKTVIEYRKGLSLWRDLVLTSDLEPFKKFLKTVTKYQDRIETYIESHLTTAVSEGINNKIKVLKRVGYTYTNQESFQNKILQRCGYINSRYIPTNNWFWHVA
jgi:transposase